MAAEGGDAPIPAEEVGDDPRIDAVASEMASALPEGSDRDAFSRAFKNFARIVGI